MSRIGPRIGMPHARVIAALLATLLASASLASPAHSAPSPILDFPAQISAEKQALKLLADPAIKAELAQIRAELAATPVGQTPEGAATLDRNISQWATTFIIAEIAGDPGKPRILWYDDNTPHSWHGHTITSAIAGDNPDHIYRITTIDGDGRYEIIGQADLAHRPAQFSFESNRTGQALRQNTSSPDMGAQIQMLTDQTVAVKPDGSFRITVGGPGTEPNHLRTEPGQIKIGFRDVLSDWTQRPNQLTLHRLDSATAKPRDAAALRTHILEGLPGHIRFWAHFKDKWLGGLAPNKPVGPLVRDGNWGYQAAARYVLGPDEAVVITTTRGAARYTGIQVNDAWMVAPDSSRHQASINLAQAVANPDGTYSYVVAASDPGVANWLDTDGIHDGYLLIRWQGFAPGSNGDGLLRDYRVVKLADLKSVLPATTKWVSPAQRKQTIAARAAAYRNRLN